MSSSDGTVDPARAAESNLPWILGLTSLFHSIALLFVGLRVYTRLFHVRSFGMDDALIVVSMVSVLTLELPAPCVYERRLLTDTTRHASHARACQLTFEASAH